MSLGLAKEITKNGVVGQTFGFILDDYPAASLGISFRLLNSGYIGNCCRVRRSSDNAELDIPFNGDYVDEAAILAHVGANDGFITTIYDQSGAGNNATQTVAGEQPQIVSAGTILKKAGFVAPFFDGVNDCLNVPAIAAADLFAVLNTTDLNGMITHPTPFAGNFAATWESTAGTSCFNGIGTPTLRVNNNVVSNSRSALYTAVSTGANNLLSQINSTLSGAQKIGAFPPNTNFSINGNLLELIAFPVTQAGAVSIGANILNYY